MAWATCLLKNLWGLLGSRIVVTGKYSMDLALRSLHGPCRAEVLTDM